MTSPPLSVGPLSSEASLPGDEPAIAPPAADPLALAPNEPEAPPALEPQATMGNPAPSTRKPSYVFLASVAVLTLAADLGTKFWAEKTLASLPVPKVVIKGVFSFLLAKNKGGAWGLLQSSSEKIRKPFFVIVSLLAIVFIVSLYRRLHRRQAALRWGLPLVLGGALGNLVDRIRYGYVIDFIDWQATWKGAAHHWPTFNVADIAICVGVALMAIDMLSARKTDATVAPEPLAPPPVDVSLAAEPPPAADPGEPPPASLGEFTGRREGAKGGFLPVASLTASLLVADVAVRLWSRSADPFPFVPSRLPVIPL